MDSLVERFNVGLQVDKCLGSIVDVRNGFDSDLLLEYARVATAITLAVMLNGSAIADTS
jgi:hypothetical protein